MGAKVTVEGKTAIITGIKKLTGANVNSTDLRGGAALVIAALAAEGESEISNVYHVERGYENIGGILNSLGADIKKL